MNRVALSLLAVALIVAPAAAQTDQAQPQTPPVQEERTQPDAPALTGDSGLTITGTVVEVTDTSLVLDTISGRLTIQLDNRTTRPATINVGDRIAVDYTRTSTGVMIATAIRPEGATTTTGVTTQTTPATGTTVGETQLQDEQDEMAPGAATGLDTEAEAEVGLDEQLPETGSALHLVGVIGLLALLAATGIRTRRSA